MHWVRLFCVAPTKPVSEEHGGLTGVPPLLYLADVLRKLADGWPEERLEDELTPDRWLELHGGEIAEDVA